MWLAPAYVLHQYAYRDTSRIVEVFTSDYGRLTLFARGANGPKSGLRGVLRPFQRMLVSWSGKGEACQLVSAEIDGVVTNLAPNRLMSGFYLNELLLKLTQRCDPHPEIFFSYASCVQALCDGEVEEPTLRRFEKRLLNDLGYGLELDDDRRGRSGGARRLLPVRPAKRAAALRGRIAGRGLRPIPGRSAGESFDDPRSLRDAKRLLRAAIDACLDGRALKSRQVALAMRHRGPLA